MRAHSGKHSLLLPLLQAYKDAGVPDAKELLQVPGLGRRFQAVLGARGDFLSEAFVDHATDADFQAALSRFYEACVPGALHSEALQRRAGILRHALGHLLRGREPLARKVQHLLAVDGPYYIAGLGPAFWSALFQGLDPLGHPAWTPAVEVGLKRLGMSRRQQRPGPGTCYAAIASAYARIQAQAQELTVLHIDHFLTLVAGMEGRNLWSSVETSGSGCGVDVAVLVKQERARMPLRVRLKEHGHACRQARQELEAGLAANDGCRIGAALLALDSTHSSVTPALDWHAQSEALTLWVGRLWEADDPYPVLERFWRADPIAGAGLWLPSAVLYLKDPQHFYRWDDLLRSAQAILDDRLDGPEPAAEQYRLYNEAARCLRDRHRLHDLEVPGILAAVAEAAKGACSHDPTTTRFGGFCADSFRFLTELESHNERAWMDKQRHRYRFAVREPMVELCRILVERYVGPVLCGAHGWDLETAPRSGAALTSICKNDYGRSVPYQTAVWITFHRRHGGGKRNDVQFFVRLDSSGLSYGLRLGREVGDAGRLFRRRISQHCEFLYQVLRDNGGFSECCFGDADGPLHGKPPSGPDDLRAWATGRTLMAAKTLSADAALLTSDDLPGDIILTFDLLLPVYLCGVESNPLPRLTRWQTADRTGSRFTEPDFCRLTFLTDQWLGRARTLLELKRQIILQGVPGTGKTHVARCLARLLTGGDEERVRLIQFHPAYCYEEFVEGIKARSVELDGRHDVTYPVEEGLLCGCAAEAERRPTEPHVLIIDEINRGNLPRVFGELLYLLEYRDQSVRLPYSKRSFRLPANLYLIGTMNAADRSVALVDQALRRRFSFLEMAPDAEVLSAWLQAHPPPAGSSFGAAVVALFKRLNARLRVDLGPQCQVGHSYFMLPGLDEARLQVVWEHHIQPLLEEYFAGQPARLAAYELGRLFDGRRRGGSRSQREAASTQG